MPAALLATGCDAASNGGTTPVLSTTAAAAAVAAAWGLVVAVRRTMVRPLQRERDRTAAERDRLAGERDALLAEREQLLQEREARLAQLQAFGGQVHALTAGHAALAAERDALLAEREELAAERDELQGSVDATFVNLAMRTLTLVERQLVLIETLEGREGEPEQLENLYRLDHLATRMRRNSENMLLLAGLENSRRGNRNVALLDVLRAAVSEIERYERVRIQFLPRVRLVGGAADDTSHLVAELLENATAFSPPQDVVEIGGWLLDNGELMISVVDRGIGIPPERLRDLNAQLDNPETGGEVEPLSGKAPWREQTASARSMGLFVVSRLARRHGIRVQLRETVAGGGTTAIVVVPREAVVEAELTAVEVDEQRAAERTARVAAAPEPTPAVPPLPVRTAEQNPPLPRRGAAEPPVPPARTPTDDNQHGGRSDEAPEAPARESRPRHAAPAQAQAETQADTETQALRVLRPRSEPRSGSQPEAQPETRTETHPESQPEAQPEPPSEPPSETGPERPQPVVTARVDTPSDGSPVTRLGLPRRVPRGGGLPGTGEGPGSGLRREAEQGGVTGDRTGATSAEELRRRLGGFQSGLRQAARETGTAGETGETGETGEAASGSQTARTGETKRGVGGSSSEEASR
ncbi:ATP-binding protein [Peterkaempfera bronchialis]|uniref:sensor histidine kinase n=1 Tax=Peterkaempfera bronchialis TaxID=2126346 RepID=UPI003C2AC31E